MGTESLNDLDKTPFGSYFIHTVFCTCPALAVVTFRVSRRRRKMYSGHARLCVCPCVRRHIPTLLHGTGCNFGEW